MNALYSMTGYAGASSEHPWGSLSIELRTVNHRYLEITWRGPEELRHLEAAMREAISARLVRGKIECRVNLLLRDSVVGGSPNPVLLDQLAKWQQDILRVHPQAGHLSVNELLNWSGMFERGSVDGEELTSLCHRVLESVLEELSASRAREGDKLRALIRERASQLETLRVEVSPRIPELVRSYQERLTQKFRDALGHDEEERVRQEVILYAARVDVEEELGRLGAHVSELQRVMERGGAVGKRLDFLMQELNREANTLASKSVASSTSAVALEMKVLIEQMREQVQNLE